MKKSSVNIYFIIINNKIILLILIIFFLIHIINIIIHVYYSSFLNISIKIFQRYANMHVYTHTAVFLNDTSTIKGANKFSFDVDTFKK